MCGCRAPSLVSYIVAAGVSWVKTWVLSSVRTLLVPRERLAKLMGLLFVCVVRLQIARDRITFKFAMHGIP
jgi:hypothetical protein